MGATAQLLRELADGERADFIAVLLAEERDEAGGARFGHGADLRLNSCRAKDLAADQVLDSVDLISRELLTVREVEPEPCRRHDGTGLADMVAQHEFQRGV